MSKLPSFPPRQQRAESIPTASTHMVGLRPCQGTTSISVSPHFPPASLLHLLAALVYLAQIDTIAGAKLNKCL